MVRFLDIFREPTISEVWINNDKFSPTTATVPANTPATETVSYAWTTGYSYQVKLVTATGNVFPYTAVA